MQGVFRIRIPSLAGNPTWPEGTHPTTASMQINPAQYRLSASYTAAHAKPGYSSQKEITLIVCTHGMCAVQCLPAGVGGALSGRDDEKGAERPDRLTIRAAVARAAGGRASGSESLGPKQRSTCSKHATSIQLNKQELAGRGS